MRINHHRTRIFLTSLAIAVMGLSLSSCEETHVPRPRGYFRIDLPEKAYTRYEGSCPVGMDIPVYSQVELFKEYDSADSCWFNLVFPRNNARIYCTYLPVHGDIDRLISDSYAFAFKHEMKADAITRTAVADDDHSTPSGSCMVTQCRPPCWLISGRQSMPITLCCGKQSRSTASTSASAPSR